ncbi:MAG: M36 family metallopeptidase [Myxococcales bacterium]|nr:M36 family metallopeptidase [Myxococcales bacterium]
MVALLMVACSTSGDPPAVDATVAASAPSVATPTAPLAQAALARNLVAQSLDDDGRPRFLRATRRWIARPGARPEIAARGFVDELAPIWGPRPPADLAVDAVHALRGGATIVALRQEVDGVPVWHGRISVLLAADGALEAIGGTRVPRGAGARAGFVLDARAATTIAVADRFPADAELGPSQALRALVPDGGRLVATWVVEAYGAPAGSTDARLWRVFVDAATGAVARREDLTVDAAFTYRVFADADAAGQPFDGPQQSFVPHPTGQPDGSQPAFVAPNLVSMEGFNSNPAGAVDPWLAATATTTTGNNVDAYADLNPPDGFGGADLRGTTTGVRTFDRTYDTAQAPTASTDQSRAAATHLFYVNNWLHDWWYDSGFDEAAGNAQVDNFGRGGVGGDAINAEAQDNSGTNNANMSTPSDGMSPRMQMYSWSGVSTHTLTVTPGDLAMANATAAFGPQVFDLTATVVVASDAAGEACGAITGANGHIVLVRRGTCSYALKAGNVQGAGGVGMIVVNNVDGTANMGGTGAMLPPALMISPADGAALEALIAAGTTSAHMVRGAVGPMRDGDLDTAVVAHEWGHYLHHRLAPCGASQCAAMSEGWGDFVGMMTVMRLTDDPHGTYAMGVYTGAASGDAYFGIRRAPYSTDFTRNGFTFRHIAQGEALPTTFPIAFGGNNQEVHNAGEVWTAMMWQAYVGLIDKDGAAIARREMTDYVVASLQLTPSDATFTEARDALLAAVQAIDPTDTMTVAQAFALRGAGTCAVSPARTSTSFVGVVEDFTVSGKLGVGPVTVTDGGVSCDSDGILDAGETGALAVTIINGGVAPLTGTVVTVSTTTPGVTIVNPSRVAAPVAGLASSIESFTIRMDPTVTAATPIAIAVQLENPAACTAIATAAVTVRANYDVLTNASATDDVEADQTVWTQTGTTGVWSRELLGTSNGWHGLDTASPTDGQLVSPPLAVGTAPLTLTFSHRFDFEWSGGTYWDGGVIELSTDGGGAWADVTTFGASPGYTGMLTDTSGNSLALRQAYGRRNAAYPARDTVSLDFGTQFANQTIQLRFRIGTDAAAGGEGWELDDLAFIGLTTTPFPVLAAEGPTCQAAPTVSAGLDRTVFAGSAVALAGTASDPNGDPLTLAWTQTGGPAVTLAGATTLTPSFTAPMTPTALTFQLAAADPFASATASVNVTVVDAPPIDAGVPIDAAIDAAVPIDAGPADPDAGQADPDAGQATGDAAAAPDAASTDGSADGGCCSTGSTGAPGSAVLAITALGLVLRRRRRGPARPA